MASDNLNQVGNYVRNTRRAVDHALRRYHPNVPKVERIRDIFDSEIPFEMTFTTERKGERVLLDLNFNKPPPMFECGLADCITTACESFTLQPGNHQVALSRGYNSGSVTVFVDAVPLLEEQYDEVSPENGYVYIQSESLDTYVATVCYAYGSCAVEEDECIALEASGYTGLAVVFADRFDKGFIEYEPACGQWGTDETPNMSPAGDGYVVFNTGGETAYLEGISAVGRHWEIAMQIRLSAASRTFSVTFSGGSYSTSLSIGTRNAGTGNRNITISGVAEFDIERPDFNPPLYQKGSIAGSAVYSEDFAAASGEYYVRFVQYPTTGWFARVWSVDEEEPTSWLTLWQLPTPVAGTHYPTGGIVSNLRWRMHILGRVSFSALSELGAITVWGDQSEGRGSPQGVGSPNPDEDKVGPYSSEACFAGPNDGVPRFGHCDATNTTVAPNNTSGSMDDSTPSFFVNMSWPFFEEGPGLTAGIAYQTESFGVPETVSLVTLKGWFKFNGNSNWNGIGLSANIYQHYFDSEPSPATPLAGSSVDSISGGINNDWQEFEVSFVPINGNVTWGLLPPDPMGIPGGLPKPDNGFMFPPTSGVSVSFRQLRAYSNGILLCTTKPHCPDDEEWYMHRCGTGTDSFANVPNTDFSCITENHFYTNNSGQRVWIVQISGSSVESTGSSGKITFRARGLTTNGSDGRCAREGTLSTHTATGTSETSSAANFKLPTPAGCSGFGESYFEFYASDTAPVWTRDQGGTRTPTFELTFGAMDTDLDGFIIEMWQGSSVISSSGMFPSLNFSPIGLNFNTWYSVRYRSEGATTSVKIWNKGSSEPGTWLHTGTTGTPANGFNIEVGYNDYMDDNFFVEIANYSSVEI